MMISSITAKYANNMAVEVYLREVVLIIRSSKANLICALGFGLVAELISCTRMQQFFKIL